MVYIGLIYFPFTRAHRQTRAHPLSFFTLPYLFRKKKSDAPLGHRRRVRVGASLGSAAITYQLQRVSNPTSDQSDAYAKIDAAMRAATRRYNALPVPPNKTLTVQYVPSVQTADGNFNGNIRFGSNRSYMNERTALHEISHTLGIGQTRAFDTRCAANNLPKATKLL